jgi:hypothetical protein
MMMSLTKGQNEGDMMQAIMGKISAIDDPEHMQELVLLAIDMMLKRAEDKPLRNLLIWRAHIAISNLLNEGTLTVDVDRRQQAVENCTELLQAAREQRQPRRTIEHESRIAEIKSRGKPTMSWPLFIAIILSLLVLIAALFGLASPAAYSQTPSALAAQIEAAPATVALRPNPDGTHFYLAHSPDDRTVVVAQEVPRRMCGATGLLLARNGLVTINGSALPHATKLAAAALCYGHSGNATLTWTPVAGTP